MTQRDAIPTIKQGNINQWVFGMGRAFSPARNTPRMTNWRQQIIPVKKNTKEGKYCRAMLDLYKETLL